MYGSHRELVAVQCCVCKRFTALRLDKDDLARHQYGGVLIQDAFRYLDSGKRELLLTATCPECWARLCPDPAVFPLAYN